MKSADRQTLARKLEFLRTQLELLEPYRQLGVQELLANPEKRLATERLLELSIQSVIDGSRLLVSIEGWKEAKDGRDALVVLAEQNVIGANLSIRLLQAKAFRNILVHEYVEIEPERLVEHLHDDLGDLWDFARDVATWLQDQAPSAS